ncbi:MAG TPA: CHAT domain-containing protein [Rickettsiales bacterium]|nr:CHAT domain-containing protein [Rickettsiales bacterium]
MTNTTLPRLFNHIITIIPVEDGDPHQASFLQGFAPSLLNHSWLVRIANTLPSTIDELAPDMEEIRLPRRMAGQAPVSWYAQSPKALASMMTPVFTPFVLFMLGQEHKIEKYQSWINAHPFPLTVLAETGGTIAYKDFNLEKLRNSFLKICDALEGKVHAEDLVNARLHLASWIEPQPRQLSYQVGGHNANYPNMLTLNLLGYKDIAYGPFRNINNGIVPYVEEITKTTQSILQERDRIGEREVNRYFRRPPGLNLFAPAIYPHFKELPIGDAPFSINERKKFLAARAALEQQEGYAFEAKTMAKAEALFGGPLNKEPKPHFLMQERARELKFAAECMATLSVSEISAVLRLPNAVNRTSGQVRQFAQQYRARQTTERKRIEKFKELQNKITASIPSQFFQFIESAEDGIRIISDAHLEWINIKGLPLCIQKDVTRIPVTPGNLYIDQISPKPYIHLRQRDFSEILILSALQETDPISRWFAIAIETFAPRLAGKVTLKTERIRNEEDLIKALNSFEGAMVIFDGHGGHESNRPAKLQLLEEEIDIWQLRSKVVRVPPIVVLSACDTHAADRNHASTANGFLACGARAVLGAVFPIDARDAAVFVARLLYRITDFIPRAHKAFSRSLTWMEIMSGMIRMQLVTDFLTRLEDKNIINEVLYKEIHLDGNIAINAGEDWPFEVLISKIVERSIDENLARKELYAATVNSTSLSYLQVGRPETIIIHKDNHQE